MRNINQKEAAQEILQIFVNHGIEQAYLVGGCVRDQLFGLIPKDYDIATSADIETISSLFPGSKHVEAAQAYPVVIYNGIEIATFRQDGKDRNDCEGIVTGADIYQDAFRRDFCINALYMDMYGEILDPTGQGFEDIENRILRTVGNPHDRFGEDPLRVIRGVRFAAKYGLTIEPLTLSAINGFSITVRETC